MQEEGEAPLDEDRRSKGSEENVRPQRGGEAATTRFGMEDGDNTDIPATGGPTSEEEDPERSSK